MHARYLTIAMAMGIVSILFLVPYAMAKNLSAQDFVTKASIANRFEIESSKLALQKAQNDEVKSFAQQMVDDHTETGDKLEKILSSSDSDAKAAQGLDNKHKRLLGKLKAASGKDFDRKYIRIQTNAHKEAVQLFSNYSKQGKDSALKGFATDTLPTLKEHLERIQSLNKDE